MKRLTFWVGIALVFGAWVWSLTNPSDPGRVASISLIGLGLVLLVTKLENREKAEAERDRYKVLAEEFFIQTDWRAEGKFQLALIPTEALDRLIAALNQQAKS